MAAFTTKKDINARCKFHTTYRILSYMRIETFYKKQILSRICKSRLSNAMLQRQNWQ